MITLPVARDRPDPRVIGRAASVLRDGGLVAFPTETVYGLGANALDAEAVDRIFEAKGRPGHNPLIIHTLDASGARALARAWPAAAERLAAAFWPGPLTLVLPKRELVPDRVTAGLPSVALRVPAHPVAAALLRAAEIPIAAPSANPSNGISPTRAAHVETGLGGRVDLILDGGPCPVGIESTVISLVSDPPRLLRPGTISPEQLRGVVPELVIVSLDHLGVAGPLPSPGMLARHYAPRAKLVLLPADVLEEQVYDATWSGVRVGVISRRGDPGRCGFWRTLPRDPRGYAAELYAALHDMDAARCEFIVVEEVPETPEWSGVRDRLRRAAHP